MPLDRHATRSGRHWRRWPGLWPTILSFDRNSPRLRPGCPSNEVPARQQHLHPIPQPAFTAIIDRLTDTPDEDIFVCSVVKGEMFYGSERSARRERNLAVQRAFFGRYVSLPFDDAAAEKY